MNTNAKLVTGHLHLTPTFDVLNRLKREAGKQSQLKGYAVSMNALAISYIQAGLADGIHGRPVRSATDIDRTLTKAS